MNPRLIDPNNHVPAVSPEDGWGDVDESFSRQTLVGTTLPPRRKPLEPSADEPAPAESPGLRIDFAPARRADPEDLPQRLEVQEISGSIVRLGSADPVSQKIPRQTVFQERPAELPRGSRRTRNAWGKSHHHASLRWIVTAGVGIFALIVGGLFLLPVINAPNAGRVAPPPDILTMQKPPAEDPEGLLFLVPKYAEATAMFAKFTAARTVDEIVPLLRDGPELEPVLRQHWQPLPVAELPLHTDWHLRTLGDRHYALLSGSQAGQPPFRAVFLQQGDRLVLDWKATTGFGTASPAELAAGTGDASEIRGELSTATYFNATFPEGEFRSWRLLVPNAADAVWCYTRVDSPADRAIAPLLEMGVITGEQAPERKVTLRLERGPETAQPNQWLIAELLHEEWVKP